MPIFPQINELMALVAVGDSDAFGRLYDAVSPQVHGLIVCCVGEAEAADALTQAVFVEAWATAPRYDGAKTPAITWIMALAHKQVIAWLRTTRAGEAAGARGIQLSHDRSARPWPALAVLSDSEAESLELAFFRGYTRAEIGAIYREPTETISARLRDALTQLRASTTV